MPKNSIIRITEHSLLNFKLGADNQIFAGRIVPKVGLRLSFRIDMNRTMQTNGQYPMGVDFFEGENDSPFLKFTTEEYLPDGSLNPNFVLIDKLDHNQDWSAILDALTDVIHSDRRL